ncbi:MAG: 30S ribosomal protein THX [Flammeovirgaceae bacterium]|nr:30S ribosomal protein THX [Flammeovirgaceae bacterium]
MGRGDKKTKKGKRTIGSFGVSRNKSEIKARLKQVASKKPRCRSCRSKAQKAQEKKAEA